MLFLLITSSLLTGNSSILLQVLCVVQRERLPEAQIYLYASKAEKQHGTHSLCNTGLQHDAALMMMMLCVWHTCSISPDGRPKVDVAVVKITFMQGMRSRNKRPMHCILTTTKASFSFTCCLQYGSIRVHLRALVNMLGTVVDSC